MQVAWCLSHTDGHHLEKNQLGARSASLDAQLGLLVSHCSSLATQQVCTACPLDTGLTGCFSRIVICKAEPRDALISLGQAAGSSRCSA